MASSTPLRELPGRDRYWTKPLHAIRCRNCASVWVEAEAPALGPIREKYPMEKNIQPVEPQRPRERTEPVELVTKLVALGRAVVLLAVEILRLLA